MAVRLLTRAAEGRLARTLADEGGMPSALWAGERRGQRPFRMTFEAVVGPLTYHLSLGLPGNSRSPTPTASSPTRASAPCSTSTRK